MKQGAGLNKKRPLLIDPQAVIMLPWKEGLRNDPVQPPVYPEEETGPEEGRLTRGHTVGQQEPGYTSRGSQARAQAAGRAP